MKKLMKKLAAVVMAAVITASAMVIPTTTASAAGVFDGAKKMEALEYYSSELDDGYDYSLYKIVLPSDGELTFRCEKFLSEYFVRLGWVLYDPSANIISNSDMKSSSAISELKKGTYYLKIKVNGNSNYFGQYEDRMNYSNFYYTFTPDQKPTISLKLTVTKGDTIQLGSVVENYDGKVTWETTKKSVATVSTSGKVTAKKKGTATIRAKLDSGEYVQIKIVVKNPTKK